MFLERKKSSSRHRSPSSNRRSSTPNDSQKSSPRKSSHDSKSKSSDSDSSHNKHNKEKSNSISNSCSNKLILNNKDKLLSANNNKERDNVKNIAYEHSKSAVIKDVDLRAQLPQHFSKTSLIKTTINDKEITTPIPITNNSMDICEQSKSSTHKHFCCTHTYTFAF